MKQEELFKTLISELFALNELHQEYQDNDTHFVVDTQKKEDTLTIKITLKENKDKQEFEDWLSNIDDTLFEEVLDELKNKEGLLNLEDMYQSKDYKKVIDRIKSKTKEIAQRKIKALQKLINGQ